MVNFEDLEYLKNGNDRQRTTYELLQKINIFECLKKYNPILTGTIPIEIDLPDSDIDIICECNDHDEFHNFLSQNYNEFDNFTIWRKKHKQIESTVASFEFCNSKIEIFGQRIPTVQQLAYRHMVIEYQILKKEGEDFKGKIIELKSQGVKTEPAFAKMLNISGDPYMGLLEYEDRVYIREIEQEEIEFLDEMLYQAVYVEEGTKLPKDIIKHPDLIKYIEDFGRDDDFCLVAESRGQLVGAIWIRIFCEEKRGYGFVDNKTPEMSMAVLKEYRNRGIGSMLLESLLEKLMNERYSKLSLSVDKANYAYSLYEKYGFLNYSETKNSVTMIRELNNNAR